MECFNSFSLADTDSCQNAMHPLTTGQETTNMGFVYDTIYNHFTAEELIKQTIGDADIHPVKAMHYDLD